MNRVRPDRQSRRQITQGQFAVSGDRGLVLSTLLGSCVSTCLWDETAGIGGMNHILLPDRRFGDGAAVGEGVNEMELLINGLIKAGAKRSRLKAKLFGGARMISRVSDIGRTNADFAQKFLKDEGICSVGSSLGGSTARHVLFWPASGRALVRIAEQTAPATETPAAPKSESDVQIF